jgi:molybdate transport system substrate-binding protein
MESVRKGIRSLELVAVFGLLAIQPVAYAQDRVKVLSDSPLQPALVKIAEMFRRESGHQVELGFGTSPVVHKKVLDGEAADVLIIQPNFVEELVKAGKVVAGEHPVIGRVGFGLAVRADAPARDISTSQTLKQVLLSADSLVFNNVASGNYFAKVLERLDIADTVKGKTMRVEPAAVFDRVMKGKGDDIGVGTITLITATKGLKLVGPLPPEVQSYIVYTAAPMSSTTSPEAGKAFIRFLTTPAAKAAFAATGVE